MSAPRTPLSSAADASAAPAPQRRRRWLPSVIAVFVAIGLAAVVLARGGAGADPGWVEVRRADLPTTVEASGELAAVDSELIGPPALPRVWNFKIAFLAPEGEEVSDGMPLIRFDTTDLLRDLREKENERDAAAKRLEKRRADLDIQRRREELALVDAEARLRRAVLKTQVPEDLVEGNDLETALIDRRLSQEEVVFRTARLEHIANSSQAELAALQERLVRAEREVSQIREHVEKMTVRAPKAGTVIYRTNWQGEKKQVGDSCWRTEKILEIPDLKAMVAEGSVAEALSGKLRVGQPVTLRLDAFPDEIFSGTVRRIHNTVRPRSFADPRKVVRLDIALDEADPRRMRPAMRWRGTVKVEEETARDALVIPLESVIPGPDGPGVLVQTSFGARSQSVRLGRRNEELAEVVEGLQEGQRIVRKAAAR